MALDVDAPEKAQGLIEKLADGVAAFKVGLQLITAGHAPDVMRMIRKAGGSTFYDGKFADIPNTTGEAAKALQGQNVLMFNVHASCGAKSVRAAVDNRGGALVIVVTVLTSIDEASCADLFGADPFTTVLKFARQAKEAGAQGVVCSPKELQVIRAVPDLAGLTTVVPGIRAKDAPPDDQKRTMTAAEAINAGADLLVIGRPITGAPDPRQALEAINTEVAQALAEKEKGAVEK